MTARSFTVVVYRYDKYIEEDIIWKHVDYCAVVYASYVCESAVPIQYN